MSSNNPPERDVKDFEFIQLCKFRVSGPDGDIPTQRGKLLACSCQYGLLVYATKQGFSAVQTAVLMAIDESKGKERSKVVVEDIPVLVNVSVSSPVLYMDVSCDGLYLAVVVRDQNHLNILFYDIRSFADKSTNPTPFAKSQVNTSSAATVSDLSWNPAVSSMLAVCTSDGNVELIDVTDTPKIISVLVAAAGATCFCWSPKGKQLLVGRKDGSLAQYDHTLAEKKIWPCPSVLTGPHRVVDVVWQSTYVFVAAYLPVHAQPSDQPVVVMSSSNKENKITNINFEDVCFGNCEDRKPQYFFHLVQKWDVILMASSNATETTIVGRNLDNKVSWEHWNLEDCCRAELPLTSQQNDSFPMGMAVDYSPHKNIVISESKVLPPCPVMYLLSTDGMLVGYHLFYSHPEAAPTTTPALPLTTIGARKAGPELAHAVSPSSTQGFLQSTQPAQASVFSPAVVAAAAAPPPYPTPATLPAQTSTVKATFPSPVSTAAAAAFSFPATPSSSSRLPFANFTSPASTTAAPLFPFAGLGAKPGAPPSGIANQKQQTNTQAPPTSAFSQSGPSLFAFGNQTPNFSFGTTPAATSSSALPSVGSSFTFSPATSGPGKPFPQSQPSNFGSGLPAVTHSGFTSVTSASSVLGLTETALSTKGEGSKTSPHITTSGPGQLHAVAPSVFISKPSTTGQAGLSPQTPGNGLVLGNVLRGTPNSVAQPSQLEPARPPAPQSSQPSVTPVIALATQPDSTKFIDATVDSAFTQNILEEIVDFERELAELRARSRREVKTVGTREEMQSLRQDKEKMINFTTEINTATKEQLLEVQEQKAMCFNLLAMSEECQSRHKRELDPHYHSLLLGRVLDPASAERLRSLQQMSQAVEQSVLEVDHALDAKWQEHLSAQKKEKRFYSPAGDTVYKSIRNNHLVISSQRQHLDKLEEQLNNLRLYNKLSGRALNSVSTLNGDEISPLKTVQKAETTLSSTLTNGMTPERVAKLKEILSQRKVPRVRSTAPANLSMSRIVHLTPDRSPAGVSSTTPPQQQPQETPQRPQQQRKHQLPHQIQTASSPLNFQSGTSTGQIQPGFQKQPNMLQQASAQTKPFSAVDGAHRSVSGAPPSFSGVNYMKQHMEGAEVGKSSILTGVTPSPVNAVQPGMAQVSGARLPLSSTPMTKLDNVPRQDHVVSGASSVSHPTVLLQHLYENITPTETEEEEEDDYDEEDNGYEDEEEEEDEEETGFDGIPLGNSQQFPKPGGQSLPTSSLAQMLGQQTQPRSNSGGSSAGVSFGGTSANSGNIFKLPQTDNSAQAFTPLKTTVQTSALPGSTNKPSPVTTSTTLTSKKDLFGTKTATGFTFGGPAVFGDKPGPRLPLSGQVPVFGSQTTLSKAVGFIDLTEKSTSVAGKDNLGETASSTAANTTSQSPSLPASSASASPSAAAVSSAASAFSFIQAAAGTDAPSGGDTKPATTSVFASSATPTTSSAVRSVFGGRSPSDGSKFSFGTTPSSTASASAGFAFGTGPSAAGSNMSPVFGAAAEVNTSPASSDAEKNLVKSAAVDKTSQDSPAVGTTSETAVSRSNVWGVADAQDSNQDVSVTTSSSTPAEANTMEPAFGAVSSSEASNAPSSAFFGSGSLAAATTSVFGSQSTPPLFGNAAPSTGATPPFGTKTTTTTSASALPFGAKSSSIFGGQTTASVFGANSVAATSVFGVSPATTTATSVFGTVTTSSSVFGGGSVSSSSPFEGGVTTAASSPFGGGVTTAASSPFGGGVTTAASSPFSGASSSVFGDPTTSKPSTFGFGTATTPVFGVSSSHESSGTGVFGSGGLFGTGGTTGAASAGTSVFGAVPASTSAFSSSTPSQTGSIFGQTTTSAGFGFGQTSNTAGGGGSALFGQNSTFGQQPSSSSSGSLFGFGGLGGKPSEEKAKLNVFGSPQVFGNTVTQNSNLFGSGSSSSFGGSDASPTFSSSTGRFSAAASGVAASGFGVTVSQQTSGGFGATPTFGSASSFGSAASFGGSAAFGNKMGGFGSSPSFGGSPAFGSSPAFSSPGGSSATFGNSTGGGFSSFASAAAPSFGQLAQASPAAPGFGTGAGFGSASQTQSSPFGGGFGSTQSSFGSGSVFGQATSSPGFGGSQTSGFGTSSTFGGNPAFSSYRG